MSTAAIEKLFLFITLSCCILLCQGRGYSNSVAGYPLRVFKKGKGLMMCDLHPRNCPGIIRKRADFNTQVYKDTDIASITELYLQNRQFSLGSLHKLLNQFLDVRQNRRDYDNDEDLFYDSSYSFEKK